MPGSHGWHWAELRRHSETGPQPAAIQRLKEDPRQTFINLNVLLQRWRQSRRTAGRRIMCLPSKAAAATHSTQPPGCRRARPDTTKPAYHIDTGPAGPVRSGLPSPTQLTDARVGMRRLSKNLSRGNHSLSTKCSGQNEAVMCYGVPIVGSYGSP